MKSEIYKGYRINAKTEQLAEDNRWTTRAELWRTEKGEAVHAVYDEVLTFGTKEEAEEHCIVFGKRVIDGHIAGQSAP